ncbi:MAG: hypothetical protein INR71_00090 [Terriglobus roseus]|nr:hypothetical protein [Terriglobus roseus]
MANFGPTATVFTIDRGFTIHQYDINPNGTPTMVATAHHVLANLPPSPPNSVEEQRRLQQEQEQLQQSTQRQDDPRSGLSHNDSHAHMPVYLDTGSSEDDSRQAMSPLAKIAQETQDLEDELRDAVPPLGSPSSSKSSATSSNRSQGKRGHSRQRYANQLKERAQTNKMYLQQAQSETTLFSASSTRSGVNTRDSVSMRSVSSSSSRHGTSRLRQEILRSPDETQQNMKMDLFPYTKARLSEVDFRTPRYDGLTVDDLRIQMLATIFGWEDEAETLVRDELERHQPGTASSVLLSKWLGDSEADIAAASIGSESMTSSDWMFLALSGMGNSQKKVAEQFVMRLLEKGDIHPAVAILIGLDEAHDAIEIYVSRRYYMEAVLLTCLTYPRDWQRISHLVRKWGATAVADKQPELAVRCFSCTSMEASDAYLSPRAQDAQYAAAQQRIMGAMSPPMSPPGSDVSRMRPQTAGLKLVTNFDPSKAANVAGLGVTPIAESAITPGGLDSRMPRRLGGDSARTATPGGFQRNRFPSRPGADRSAISESTPLATAQANLPLTATRTSRNNSFSNSSASGTSQASRTSKPSQTTHSSKQDNLDPADAAGDQAKPLMTLSPLKYKPGALEAALPSPAAAVFTALTAERSRNGSRTRKPDSLHLEMQDQIVETAPETSTVSFAPGTGASSASRVTVERSIQPSPPPTSGLASAKIRSIDNYISSLQEANYYAEQQRTVDRQRASSREPRGSSRTRDTSQRREPRGRSGVTYIRGAKRSPSSPVSMSPDDPALRLNLGSLNQETSDTENFYRVASPVDGNVRGRSNSKPARQASKPRSGSKRAESPGSAVARRQRSNSRAKALKTGSRRTSPDRNLLSEGRGRSQMREGSHQRSPSSPLPMSAQAKLYQDDDEDEQIEQRAIPQRKRSTSRRQGSRSVSRRRDGSPEQMHSRARSSSRTLARDPLPDVREEVSPVPRPERKQSTRTASRSRLPRVQTDLTSSTARQMTKKELAAKELEERRLSLARRPSAPAVMHPDEIERTQRSPVARSPSGLSPRSKDARSPSIFAEMGLSSLTSQPSWQSGQRSYDAPNSAVTGTSTTSVPIGLPATPRAMRHPKYMTAEPHEPGVPAVPEVPSEFQTDASKAAADDGAGFLLPALTYNSPRSATAPPERERIVGQRRGSLPGNASNHFRKASRPQAEVITDEDVIEDSQVVIVEESALDGKDPFILPELQHLAGPPPPPPPPSMYSKGPNSPPIGVISVAIDETAQLDRGKTPLTASTTTDTVPTLSSSRGTTPAALEALRGATPAQSPQTHRRGRGSVGGVGEKVRNLRDRMRSTSRNGRVKSPPLETAYAPSPYESIAPMSAPAGGASFSFSRTTSPLTTGNPYETIPTMPMAPPPVPALPIGLSGDVDGGSKTGTPFQGYRNPKEVRANMPPEQLQMGVYHPSGNVI